MLGALTMKYCKNLKTSSVGYEVTPLSMSVHGDWRGNFITRSVSGSHSTNRKGDGREREGDGNWPHFLCVRFSHCCFLPNCDP